MKDYLSYCLGSIIILLMVIMLLLVGVNRRIDHLITNGIHIQLNVTPAPKQ